MTRAFVTLLAVLLAAPVSAQTGAAPPPARGEMQFGPLTLRPRLDVRELGIDSNVFNAPTDPQEDFTATVTPKLEALLDLGWGRARYTTSADFVYFHEFSGERSINGGNEGRFELLLDRFKPFVAAAILDTRDRLNAEVDARAHRREWRTEAGAIVAITARTSIVATVRRSSLAFADDEVFNGVVLAGTLNNDSDLYEAGLRFELTPLTAIQLTGAYQRDRFDAAGDRDARAWRVGPMVEFAPTALVSGRLIAGYEHFDPENASVPPYKGLTALGTLAWSVDSTKLEGTVERAVRYSFEEQEPYYVTTGGRLMLTQMIGGPFDVQVLAGRHQFAYREFDQAGAISGPSRTDTVTTWGGGGGFRLGQTARIGVTFEQTARRSPRAERSFDRQRMYGSLSYGF